MPFVMDYWMVVPEWHSKQSKPGAENLLQHSHFYCGAVRFVKCAVLLIERHTKLGSLPYTESENALVSRFGVQNKSCIHHLSEQIVVCRALNWFTHYESSQRGTMHVVAYRQSNSPIRWSLLRHRLRHIDRVRCACSGQVPYCLPTIR
jgi:hypothetical protein